MNKILCYLLPLLFLIACNEKNKPQSEVKESGVAIVIHGGAGWFASMTEEEIEGIELLRALENNISIGTFISKSTSFSVDVNDDLLKAINEMPKNPIRKKY